MSSEEYDVAVVGSGIVGLGVAAAARARGLRVVVVDRAAGIVGASVRNFGHLGFTAHAGEAGEHARRSRELWLRYAERAGIWMRRAGTLIVARSDDELALAADAGLGRVLTGRETRDAAPVASAVGGLLLPDDLQVDPRSAAVSLAAHLAGEGVVFRHRTAAVGAETGVLHTARGEVRAQSVVFAVNAEVGELFPDIAAQHAVERCRLDMLLLDGVGLGVPVLTGTSLLRYSAFSTGPAAASVRRRLEADEPDLFARDVNEMYTERPDGSLIAGDTHAVAPDASPFQDEDAFALLHSLAERMWGRPLRVRERWQGVYAKAPADFLRAAPAEGVRVVSVTTGIGMTTGLGLGESIVTELWGACA